MAAASDAAKRLHYAIVEYLMALKGNAAYDAESIDVSLPVLTELFGVNPPRDAAVLKVAHSLPEVFAAGVAALAKGKDAGADVELGAFSDAAEEKKFGAFVEHLKAQNFFAGCDLSNTAAGSAYAQRVSKARAKYIANRLKRPVALTVTVGGATGAGAAATEAAAGVAAAAGKGSPAAAATAPGGVKMADDGGGDSDGDADPDIPPVPAVIDDAAKRDAEKCKEQGNKALGEEKLDVAIRHYTDAIARNPTNVVYWSNRAQAYINKSDWSRAIRDARRAIAVDAKYYKAHYRLGVALQGKAQHKEAVAAFNAALAAADANADTRTIKQLMAKSQAALGGAAGAGAGGAGAGGFDFAGLMNNPMLQGLMNNPALRDMANQFGGAAGAGGAGGAAGGAGGLDFGKLMSDPNIMNMAQGLMADPNMANMLAGLAGGVGGAGAGAGAGAAGAAAAAAAAGRPAAAAGGAAGGNAFYNKMMSIPAIAALKDDPDLVDTFADFEVNGQAALSRALANPKAMQKLSSVMGQLMAGMGGAK